MAAPGSGSIAPRLTDIRFPARRECRAGRQGGAHRARDAVAGRRHRIGSAPGASPSPTIHSVRWGRRFAGPRSRPTSSAGRRSGSRAQRRNAAPAGAAKQEFRRAPGRCGMAMTSARSGLPAKIPSVPANTSASIEAAGNARLMLRMSGVVSSTSPSRRNATTSTRGLLGKASGVMAPPAGDAAGGNWASRSTVPPTMPTPNT